MAKSKNKAVEPERCCAHDYPPGVRRNKHHFIPPRTAHDVFHALFLLQHKLPREIAVRVLDEASYWIWETVECQSRYSDKQWPARNTFMSYNEINWRDYARMRCLIFGLEVRSFEPYKPNAPSETFSTHNSLEAMFDYREGRRAGTKDTLAKKSQFRQLEEVVEKRGKFICSKKRPVPNDLMVTEFDKKMEYTWCFGTKCHKRTSHCAHILYALV